jgi:hypothetical protein
MPTDAELEFQAAERALRDAINDLRQMQGRVPIPHHDSDPSTKAEPPLCSFCGKGSNQVRKLVGGTNAYICDECTILVAEVMADE